MVSGKQISATLLPGPQQWPAGWAHSPSALPVKPASSAPSRKVAVLAEIFGGEDRLARAAGRFAGRPSRPRAPQFRLLQLRHPGVHWIFRPGQRGFQAEASE
jgi:hypothetical protein